MKLVMEAKIEKLDEGYQIFAQWDKDIKVKGESLNDAQAKFDERLKELGIKKEAVTYQMGV